MRTLLLLVLIALALPAMAEKLDVERIFSDPALAGSTPRQLEISPDNARVTFLRGKPDDQHQLDLWEYNLADGEARRLVDSRALELDGEHLSDAEKARRERARTADLHGILDYSFSPDGKQFLFPVSGKLYLYTLGVTKDKAIRELDTGGDALDPKISPEGRYVSYVRDQNLWVIDLKTGDTTRLTQDGGDTVHNGQAEFVAQEEMDRRTGYWWAPDDSAIAFERYDEAQVPVTDRFEVYADHTAVVPQRYPFAGDPNVTVKLGLIALDQGSDKEKAKEMPNGPDIGNVRWIDLGDNPDVYLTRVKWLPDGKHLSYQLMQRSQRRLDLKLVDVSTLAQHTLLTERSRTWINLNKDLRFLKHDDAFIWGSERSGEHHLYLYGLDGKLRHPISSGDWTLDKLLAVDEKRGLVYVASNRDFVPDKQVYAVKLDGSNADAPQRISRRDGWHEAHFAKDGSFYVDDFSDLTTPPQVSVRKPDGSLAAWLEQNKLGPGHPYWPYHDKHVVPTFGTLEADDGQSLYYELFKPADFDPGKRYPVFFTYYGGPGSQQVSRRWPNAFKEYMAQQGFVVFTLDNRGMARRGRKFSDPIFRMLGDVEVRDQLEGVKWLKQQPWVDGGRIGAFGWSYGGYMTVMLLSKASDEFAGGVAVAPVTDWSLYDTFYTERYLDRPQDNAAGYTRSAVFAWLDGLTAPFQLVHGMADDNVLFLNSTRLMAALQERGTQFRLMTYPGGKHGLSPPATHQHVYHLIAQFFQDVIKRGRAWDTHPDRDVPAPAMSDAGP